MNVCRVCRRTAHGFAYENKAACSLEHVEILQRTRGMIDPDQYEADALEAAGDKAGEYLDALEKTDLATMSEEEWKAFIAVVVEGYVERLAEIAQAFADASTQIRRKVEHGRHVG